MHMRATPGHPTSSSCKKKTLNPLSISANPLRDDPKKNQNPPGKGLFELKEFKKGMWFVIESIWDKGEYDVKSKETVCVQGTIASMMKLERAGSGSLHKRPQNPKPLKPPINLNFARPLQIRP